MSNVEEVIGGCLCMFTLLIIPCKLGFSFLGILYLTTTIWQMWSIGIHLSIAREREPLEERLVHLAAVKENLKRQLG